jgi:hypothetical protein
MGAEGKGLQKSFERLVTLGKNSRKISKCVVFKFEYKTNKDAFSWKFSFPMFPGIDGRAPPGGLSQEWSLCKEVYHRSGACVRRSITGVEPV